MIHHYWSCKKLFDLWSCIFSCDWENLRNFLAILGATSKVTPSKMKKKKKMQSCNDKKNHNIRPITEIKFCSHHTYVTYRTWSHIREGRKRVTNIIRLVFVSLHYVKTVFSMHTNICFCIIVKIVGCLDFYCICYRCLYVMLFFSVLVLCFFNNKKNNSRMLSSFDNYWYWGPISDIDFNYIFINCPALVILSFCLYTKIPIELLFKFNLFCAVMGIIHGNYVIQKLVDYYSFILDSASLYLINASLNVICWLSMKVFPDFCELQIRW